MSESSIPIELRHRVLYADNVMQAVSMSCSVLIIAGYFFIRSVDKELDRISLRLLVETCVANLVFGVSQLLLNSEYALNSYKKCAAVMSFFVLADVATSLLMTCIAINLLLVIVFRTRLKLSMKALELCYTIGSVSISIFMAITPFFTPEVIYSYSEQLKQCWFASSDPPTASETFWELWLFHLWPMIGVTTTLVCFGIVLIKLRQEEIKIDENLNAVQTSADKWFGLDDAKVGKDNDLVEQAKESIPQAIKRQGSHMSENSYLLKFLLPRRWSFKRNNKMREAAHDAVTHNRHVSYVGKTIRQVICYSLGVNVLTNIFVVLIITQTFNFVSFVDTTASNRHQPVYYFLSYISTALRGPLLLLCFLIDPALWSAVGQAWRRRQGQKCDLSTPSSLVAEVPSSGRLKPTEITDDSDCMVITESPSTSDNAQQLDGLTLRAV